MSVISVIVIFCSTWAIVFFLTLPFGTVSQDEAGEIVPGTPASAPARLMLKRKVLITTCITTVLCAMIFSVLYWRLFTLDDIPFFTPPLAR